MRCHFHAWDSHSTGYRADGCPKVHFDGILERASQGKGISTSIFVRRRHPSTPLLRHHLKALDHVIWVPRLGAALDASEGVGIPETIHCELIWAACSVAVGSAAPPPASTCLRLCVRTGSILHARVRVNITVLRDREGPEEFTQCSWSAQRRGQPISGPTPASTGLGLPRLLPWSHLRAPLL